MSERITATQFNAGGGVDDWRVVFDGACTVYRTGSFAKGVALVDAVGALADAADHHPDIELHYGSVAIRLITHDVGWLTARDRDLARQISTAAADLGIEADPDAVQTIQLTIDATDRSAVMPFWRAVLGYDERGDEDLVDPREQGPSIWFQDLRRTARPSATASMSTSRCHRTRAEARIDAALAAGGRLVSDANAPRWWTLADSEGNEVDVAIWAGQD